MKYASAVVCSVRRNLAHRRYLTAKRGRAYLFSANLDGFGWAAGRHSGFPTCCVLFYCLWWGRLPVPLILNRAPRDPDHPGYVRCPLCVRRDRRVPVHKCGPGCPPRFRRTLDA